VEVWLDLAQAPGGDLEHRLAVLCREVLDAEAQGLAFDAYFSLAGRDAGTALRATMIALKTLELRRPRDLRLVMVLFGFLLVSQFLFDQSPGLALYLGLLFVANVALMADLAARCPDRTLRDALRPAGSLTLALVLFVLFPRLRGFENTPNPRQSSKQWFLETTG